MQKETSAKRDGIEASYQVHPHKNKETKARNHHTPRRLEEQP